MAKQKSTTVILIATEKGNQEEHCFPIEQAQRILHKEFLVLPSMRKHNIWSVKEGEDFQFIEGYLQKVKKNKKESE